MKKVCHITSAHDSTDTRIFHKECVSLANAGYETYLVAQGANREDQGVHVIGVGEAPKNRIQRMTQFASKVYEVALSLDCDIYHLHDPELLPYGIKFKKHGKKVIFDSHENTLEQMLDKGWIPAPIRPSVSSIYKYYATKVFKKLDCLISVTPHIVDQLKAINPNTWMITNYPLLTTESNEQLKVDDNVTRLCFTGGIDPQWGHNQIVKCVGDMDGVKYELCGPTTEEYLNELKKVSGWEQVNYYGKVPFAESIRIQKNSDIGMALLCPSRNTGGNIGTIGNTKLFEYMMAGLPVICTDFELWRKIIEKWNCGICVSQNDSNAIQKAIIYLKSHPEEAHQMGLNGRKAVEEEFNWTTQEKKLLVLYKELES